MNIGWIGTGIMGRSMAGHLLAAGHALHLFNRTKAKAADLLARGAAWCATPTEVGAQSEIVFTMVGFPADVEEVYFGPVGLFSGKPAFRLCVDMTTAPPALALRIAAAARASGARALDAPVSGGDAGARSAALAIMAGGDREAFDEALPLFALLGKHIVHLAGPARDSTPNWPTSWSSRER
jgi:3-hydroxyisobutyrate dehydrogenase